MPGFVIATGLLKNLVSTASRFSQARSPDERFLSLWVCAENGKVSVMGEDSFGGFCKASADAEVNESVSFFVQKKLFSDAVNAIDSEQVAVGYSGKVIQITGKAGFLRIPESLSGPEDRKATGNLVFEAPKLSMSLAMHAASFAYRQVKATVLGTSCIVCEKGRAVLCASDDSRGTAVSKICVVDICPADFDEKSRIFFDSKEMGVAMACCHGDFISLFSDEKSLRLESEGDGIVTVCGFQLNEPGRFYLNQIRSMKKTKPATIPMSGEFFSAIKQASVVKLPEAVSAGVNFLGEAVEIENKTVAGQSKFLIGCSEVDHGLAIRVNLEDIESAGRGFKKDSPLILSVMMNGDEPRGLVMESAAGGIVFMSSLIEQ